MNSNIVILRVDTLPLDFDTELLPAAILEGFEPIQWLKDAWDQGRNRFSEPGEAFYTARVAGRLVGVCGVNQDPFEHNATVARLRRLYVMPQFRRMGVGGNLVQRALKDAGRHFKVMRLRTLDHESAQFFEALGFTRVEDEKRFTHVQMLG